MFFSFFNTESCIKKKKKKEGIRAITRMLEYLPILIIIIFSLVLSCVIVGASYVLALKRGDTEKVSVYESGFDPVGDSRQKFAVRFFLVAIVFIIFDLEVSFLFP